MGGTARPVGGYDEGRDYAFPEVLISAAGETLNRIMAGEAAEGLAAFAAATELAPNEEARRQYFLVFHASMTSALERRAAEPTLGEPARSSKAELKALIRETRLAIRARRLADAAFPGEEEIAARLAARPIPADGRLGGYAMQVTSQHGEDGIVYEMVRRLGMPTRRCVEIGCGLNGGNVGLLAAVGYKALMIDGSADLTAIARRMFARCDVDVVQAWISPDEIDGLLADHGMTGDIDYLGVDLDGVDYWVLQAVSVVAPKMIVAEYNQIWDAEVSATIPNLAGFQRKALDRDGRRIWPKGFYGVSLAGLVNGLRPRGYRLVAEHMGNAFFVQDGLLPDAPTLTAAEAWRAKIKRGAHERTRVIRERGVLTYYREAGHPLVEIPAVV